MAQLEERIKSQVESLIEQAMSVYSPENINPTIEALMKAWELLPEPKENWYDGFLVAKYITHTFFNVKDFENAEVWARNLRAFNKVRDFGESEFISGKVALELGKEEDAYQFFKVADEKSEGRVWKGEKDMKYFKFFKSR